MSGQPQKVSQNSIVFLERGHSI